MICTARQILFRWLKGTECDWLGMWHVWWGRREMHTGFWWGGLREGNHLEDPGVDGRIILKWIFKNLNGEARVGLLWLGLRHVVKHFWMRWWTFGFHKMRGICWLAEELLASLGVLCLLLGWLISYLVRLPLMLYLLTATTVAPTSKIRSPPRCHHQYEFRAISNGVTFVTTCGDSSV